MGKKQQDFLFLNFFYSYLQMGGITINFYLWFVTHTHNKEAGTTKAAAHNGDNDRGKRRRKRIVFVSAQCKYNNDKDNRVGHQKIKIKKK